AVAGELDQVLASVAVGMGKSGIEAAIDRLPRGVPERREDGGAGAIGAEAVHHPGGDREGAGAAQADDREGGAARRGGQRGNGVGEHGAATPSSCLRPFSPPPPPAWWPPRARRCASSAPAQASTAAGCSRCCSPRSRG